MQFFRHRRDRGRPPHPDVLTPAEWRVLEHVRQGVPNAEIAVRLGISVPTVKTHVSSMLAKLDLPHRHALAAWDGEPVEASRVALGRFGLAAPLGWLRDALGAAWVGKAALVAGVAGISAAAVVGIASLNGAEPGVAPPLGATTATATPAAAPALTPTPPPGALSGVFRDPRPTDVSEVIAIPEPRSPFPPYDRGDLPVRVYDFATGRIHELGPGRLSIVFTDDGRYAAWNRARDPGGPLDEGVVAVLDLESGDVRELIEGRPWGYRPPALGEAPGPSSLIVSRDGELSWLDVATGQATAIPSETSSWTWVDPETGQEIAVETYEAPPPEMWGGYEYERHRLRDPESGEVVIRFDAMEAAYAGDGHFVFATPPVEGVDGREWSNLFLVDIETRAVTFIASTEFDVQMLLAANERYVAWNERFCSWDGSDWARTVRLYDRESGEIVELVTDLAIAIARRFDGSLLGLSRTGFGVDAWLDLETMEWHEVMPEGSIHASWSDDRRYAGLGWFGGHGGLCP